MVQANPAPQGGNSNTRRVRPIPIGEDHLQFKHDPQIQGQLDHNGKSDWPHSILPHASYAPPHPLIIPHLRCPLCSILLNKRARDTEILPY